MKIRDFRTGELTGHEFRDDQRFIAKVGIDLKAPVYSRLRKALYTFTKKKGRILILNCRRVSISLERSGTMIRKLIGPEDLKSVKTHTVSVDMFAVDFVPGDILFVQTFDISCPNVRKLYIKTIEDWAGREVEVVPVNGGQSQIQGSDQGSGVACDVPREDRRVR